MASNQAMVNEELPPEKFAEKISRLIDNASVSMAIAVGSELGIFSVMAQLEKPETSEFIAKKSGLIERYVREWLAALVTGKIVHYNRDDNTYFLPRSYIPLLKGGSMTMFSTILLMFSERSQELNACFRNGGGIPYSSYKEFHRWMNEFSTRNHKANLVDVFIPSIEGLKEKLESGIKVLDIGCGSGSPGLIMAAKFPRSEFYGFDISEEAITKAKEEAERQGLVNAHFKVQDCANLDLEYQEDFDYVTAFDSIHDQAHPDKVLAETCKVLKKEGIFSLVDINSHSNVADNIGQPLSCLKYVVSLFHCMPVSLYFEGGKGLGTCWGKELATDMIKKAGFTGVDIRHVANDHFHVHILCTK
eukprot:gene5096-213_t